MGRADELKRAYRFVASAKGQLPPPEPQGDFHQPCEEFVEGLKAQPWWDTAEFPWVAELEAQAPTIGAELQRYLAAEAEFVCDSAQRSVMGEGWSAVRLQRMGEWRTENTAAFPETTAILKGLDIPFAVRGIMFARQVPGSGVAPHSDARNFILTAHLGLKVPEDPTKAWMQVGAERRNWEENKAVIFDTSFEHSTGNESDEERVVLIIDFWHPDLSLPEREALQMVYDTRNKYDGAAIQAQEDAARGKEQKVEASGGGLFDAVKGMFGGN
mmetsp:Transcript_33510/g.105892  ORF Transcript_33510/g.105892 Transcript_33510/m.105892 type:complete len:271 (+) Transcript_33510:164-976(+)